ncbi:uncharacterized protein LOC129574607 isoform X2 [Sitodiplosis mosellana]|uniref:uncharacterized protein LOC129574607 isoform X2 n=1 Tax=Sitodiplosis mosellana TaxID=263140 RepID=UPI002444194C|nr:uncharacterized protein LOC129574607 isoform X2 [Sitodiplosis mosellana]
MNRYILMSKDEFFRKVNNLNDPDTITLVTWEADGRDIGFGPADWRSFSGGTAPGANNGFRAQFLYREKQDAFDAYLRMNGKFRHVYLKCGFLGDDVKNGNPI